jgi:transcriptional regulator GlxA family with amidase domain
VRTVLIVLFDDVQSLDVTGPLEVFAGARDHQGKHAYQVRTASLGGAQVRTSSGLAITPDDDLRDQSQSSPPDLLIVPGGKGARRRDPDLVAWLRAHAPDAKRVVSVCTGAFLLAEAGFLDGRRATTHWSHCETLRHQYPAIEVDPDPIFIKDGNVATSAGVTTGIDLALALVEGHWEDPAAVAVGQVGQAGGVAGGRDEVVPGRERGLGYPAAETPATPGEKEDLRYDALLRRELNETSF